MGKAKLSFIHIFITFVANCLKTVLKSKNVPQHLKNYTLCIELTDATKCKSTISTFLTMFKAQWQGMDEKYLGWISPWNESLFPVGTLHCKKKDLCVLVWSQTWKMRRVQFTRYFSHYYPQLESNVPYFISQTKNLHFRTLYHLPFAKVVGWRFNLDSN